MSFFGDLIGFESSGKNVTNERQSTSSGRARGFFQITDGTWRDFGRKAGIDFSMYPTALSAPYQVQAKVASLIPLKRWDKITLNRLAAKGHKFDVNKTLGENVAAHGESMDTGAPGAPLPAAAAVVTGAGQSQQSYASPETPVPGATQPNYFPEGTGAEPHGLSDLASAFDGVSMGDSGGGGGMSGGGSLESTQLGAMNLDARPVSASPEEIAAGKGDLELSPLADLFTLPTIGQPASKLKALQDVQLQGTA